MTHSQNEELCQKLGGINPDVVEAAALAHDLGHPPFGHVAEKALNQLVAEEQNIYDGFEGNAQSFRIVCKLSIRRIDSPGLNLSRATLNAILKYPWFRQSGNKCYKWGAYHSEEAEFNWARELTPEDERQSAEATIMDIADDIAFSVHDIEDFYRAGLLPLDSLVTSETEREHFIDKVFAYWQRINKQRDREVYSSILEELFYLFPVDRRWEGELTQRAALRNLTSVWIDRYVRNIRLEPRALESSGESRVIMNEEQSREIDLLKQLTWQYVIDNPNLARQQYGKEQVIKTLFECFLDAVESNLSILPMACRERILFLLNVNAGKQEIVREISDTISAMTDQQALKTFHQLTGIDPGSVLDYPV